MTRGEVVLLVVADRTDRSTMDGGIGLDDGSKERRSDSEAKVSWLLILTLQKGKIYQVRQGFSKNDKRLRKVLKVSWTPWLRRVRG